MKNQLKAPFPWFGGKSKITGQVWRRLGDVKNFVEPFFGSGAMLWGRPGWHPNTRWVETINDTDLLLTNFWRSLQKDPEMVAEYADYPVSEVDLTARHRWLVQEARPTLRALGMDRDPDVHDAKAAGWWVWGISQWIGSGWCPPVSASFERGEVDREPGLRETKPILTADGFGRGVHQNLEDRITGVSEKLPDISGSNLGRGIHAKNVQEGEEEPVGDIAEAIPNGLHKPYIRGGSHGCGVHRIPGVAEQLPHLTSAGMGIHQRIPGVSEQLPDITGGSGGRGIHQHLPDIAGDKHGRGVHAKGGSSGPASILMPLAARLRYVRICHGDWARVCSNTALTVNERVLTGVFLDPPYEGYENVYSEGNVSVSAQVRAWCKEAGTNPKLRIALCGYGEEHAELEKHGWFAENWKANGGYANNTGGGRAAEERIWFSPACLRETSIMDLFGA